MNDETQIPDDAEQITTETQPDSTTQNDDRQYFDPKKHVPTRVLAERIERARDAERARIAAMFGVDDIDDALSRWSDQNRELTALRGERESWEQRLTDYKAEQEQARRTATVRERLQSAGVPAAMVDKAVALAAADKVDLNGAFTDDGTVDDDKFAAAVEQIREGNPFLFGDQKSPGTKSNRGGQVIPPTKTDDSKVDDDMKKKWGGL